MPKRAPTTPPTRGSDLRDHVRAHAENRPGVYRFHDRDGHVLYVGKSVRVRARLLSYFRAAHGEKAAEMVAEADSAEWEYVPDEFGALIREMRLIHRFRPRYNVQHKRKRPFAFLKVTVDEEAPRLLAVRRVTEDGSLYYGPFGHVALVREVARELSAALGLRDCTRSRPVYWCDQLELFTADRSPGCIRAELGTCLAPCCGGTDARTYITQVQSARSFLAGEDDEPLTLVERGMRDAASRLDFEYAARLRDRRERLSYLRGELSAFRGEVEGLAFVYRSPGFLGQERLYLIRGGRVRDEIDVAEDSVDGDDVRRRVKSVFYDPGNAPHGMRAHEAAEVMLVAAWFRGRPEEMERTHRPKEWLASAGGEKLARQDSNLRPGG
jgi:excinuclease ABC subunit C